jgi:PadR family transcriptional regulator PadR
MLRYDHGTALALTCNSGAYSRGVAPEGPKRVGEAVAEAARTGEEAVRARKRRRGGRPSDVFGGEIRRRDVFPLLVLHLIAREPAYGNRLIDAIEEMTQGVISVNPNTMYPLLREMESNGLVQGRWELPDRRTRRYYSITPAGRREYRRLLADVEPFLDSVIRSVGLIKREVYGEDGEASAGG